MQTDRGRCRCCGTPPPRGARRRPPHVLRPPARWLARLHHALAPALHVLAPELCHPRCGAFPGRALRPAGRDASRLLPCRRRCGACPRRTERQAPSDAYSAIRLGCLGIGGVAGAILIGIAGAVLASPWLLLF